MWENIVHDIQANDPWKKVDLQIAAQLLSAILKNKEVPIKDVMRANDLGCPRARSFF